MSRNLLEAKHDNQQDGGQAGRQTLQSSREMSPCTCLTFDAQILSPCTAVTPPFSNPPALEPGSPEPPLRASACGSVPGALLLLLHPSAGTKPHRRFQSSPCIEPRSSLPWLHPSGHQH